MVWSVCLLGENEDGEVRRVDLLQLGSLAAPSDIDGLGINLATSKQLLSELQQAVVTVQEAALWAVSRSYTAGSTTTALKDYRLRKFQSLFGTICVRVPHLIIDGRIESVLPCLRYCRSKGEFDEVQAKLSAWMSYRSAMELMGEMYPVKWSFRSNCHAQRRCFCEPIRVSKCEPEQCPHRNAFGYNFRKGPR